MSYEIRPYQPGDEAGILNLYNQIYPLLRTPEQWAWEYRDTAAGPAVIYVISKNSEIIGHYAIIPLPAFCNGKKILLGKAEGTMIKQQERFLAARKGILKELVNRGRLDSFARGIPIIFGLTSKPRDFVMAGFQHISEFYALQKDMRLTDRSKVWFKNKLGKTNDLLDVSFVDRVVSTLNLRKKISKKRIETIVEPSMPADAATISADTKRNAVIEVERSHNYLIWRYQRNPFVQAVFVSARCEGTLLGWVAIAGNEHDTGYILDTYIGRESSDAVLYALYQKAMSYFKSKNVCRAICWRSDYADDVLKMKHFIQWGLQKQVHVISFVLQVDDQQVDPAFVMDTQNWSISMALTEGRMG